ARLMAGLCAVAAAAAFNAESACADGTNATVAGGATGSGHWAFAIGADYTNGDYGEAQDTTIYQIPLSAGFASDRFSVSLTVPYVPLKGWGDIIPGGVSAFGPGSTGGGGGGGGAVGGLAGGVGNGLGLSVGGGLINVIPPPRAAPSPPPPPGPPPP